MIVYNIVVRIADDKDFLSPIITCFGKLKDAGVSFKFNIIGKVYSQPIYLKLLKLAEDLEIKDHINFTKESIRYSDLPEEIKQGFFINYSLDDVVGYSTMEAMSLGFKTLLFNCDPSITEKSNRLSFCNTVQDLFDVTLLLAKHEEETTKQIIRENENFKASFYLNKMESDLLLSML